VAANELAGTVHGPEKVGLAVDRVAPTVGFVLVDESGMEISVDRHLPSWQAVEHESGGDFADAGRTPGNHHKLDHDEDREENPPDHHLVTRDELAERADNAAGGFETRLTTVR